MQTEEIDRILEQTLADRRLSRSERRALDMVLADAGTDEHQLAAIRHRVFEVAGRHIASPESQAILGWLEDVLKVLQPKPNAAEPQPNSFNRKPEASAGNANLVGASRARLRLSVKRAEDASTVRAFHDSRL